MIASEDMRSRLPCRAPSRLTGPRRFEGSEVRLCEDLGVTSEGGMALGTMNDSSCAYVELYQSGRYENHSGGA